MTNENQINGLLQQHNLKKTPARVIVLRTLLSSKFAASYAELEQSTKELADRITLYRILKNFEQRGIIHKTINHEGNAKYAICIDGCSNENHQDHHVHFNCTSCQQTVCLEDTDIPKITLPRGYKATQYSFSVNGICRQCTR
jgi:Fur family ferric uptake transcriptional regulator